MAVARSLAKTGPWRALVRWARRGRGEVGTCESERRPVAGEGARRSAPRTARRQAHAFSQTGLPTASTMARPELVIACNRPRWEQETEACKQRRPRSRRRQRRRSCCWAASELMLPPPLLLSAEGERQNRLVPKRPLVAPPLTALRAQVVPQARAPGDEYRRLAPAGGRPTQLVHRVWALAGRTGGRQPPHATRPSAHARCARLHGARLCGHA